MMCECLAVAIFVTRLIADGGFVTLHVSSSTFSVPFPFLGGDMSPPLPVPPCNYRVTTL
jgi:hypothetical protein